MESSKISALSMPYYELKMYMDPELITFDICKQYREKCAKQQSLVELWRLGNTVEIDAGFDLFVPKDTLIKIQANGFPVSMGINCSMTFNYSDHLNNSICIPCAYYLYPRSSMGMKTPLRLSNSVGIIDSGYRGHIIALFDNINNNDTILSGFQNKDYIINKNDRLVQICTPNITYPMSVKIVDKLIDLNTFGTSDRGSGGFGSTGTGIPGLSA